MKLARRERERASERTGPCTRAAAIPRHALASENCTPERGPAGRTNKSGPVAASYLDFLARVRISIFFFQQRRALITSDVVWRFSDAGRAAIYIAVNSRAALCGEWINDEGAKWTLSKLRSKLLAIKASSECYCWSSALMKMITLRLEFREVWNLFGEILSQRLCHYVTASLEYSCGGLH